MTQENRYPKDPLFRFVGRGLIHEQPWFPSDTEPPTSDLNTPGHPAHYIADDGLVAAVNTAMLLNKPLLVTGNPGTGKSDLAERIAWELQIGPVLRFEAQSLSEASDLFYRFDLVGRMSESRLEADRLSIARSLNRADVPIEPDSVLDDPSHALHFIEMGPLGQAILRAMPDDAGMQESQRELYQALKRRHCMDGTVIPKQTKSVVLIDEIDKASRDFPNDLLNGIQRMEFRIRELDNLLVKAPDPVGTPHAIVIITSNLERDLPGPFLRRCAFYHIPDPDIERMAEIVRARVFPDRNDLTGRSLPALYRDLLEFFFKFREKHQGHHAYEPGTTELLEVSRTLQSFRVDENSTLKQNTALVSKTLSAFAKHREDFQRLQHYLNSYYREA